MSSQPVASPLAEKYLRLHLCPEVGPIRFANLLRELGDIDTVLGAGVSRLMAVEKIGQKVAGNIARERDSARVTEEIELAGRYGVRILCLADEEYPPPLKKIEDPPACLYVKGTLTRNDLLALGVVGSRHCTRYGAEQAERFAALAAHAGMTIASGMARGIDSAAHRGALAASGRTIAVLGCGLCHIYPPESGELAEKISAAGALVSELPMGVAPDSKNFPPRNRIIAGLSMGVLIVEAARRSGALITARLASEYNRVVFAVPGRIDTASAEGCNDLIKTGAAKLVMGLPDILQELGDAGAALMSAFAPPEERGEVVAQRSLPLDEAEKTVLAAIVGEPLPIEGVCEESGLPPARVAAVLTSLQLKGVIRRLPGDLYERAGRQ
ncbi:MAG TPA: DNA-processing protein DprA [Phycisphaerae bacterium]|nr:DNA-processing protein DprA [Phycisphaerae bacterium]